MLDALPFRYIVAGDFEFEFGGHDFPEEAGRSGGRPRPVCMDAKELRSGQKWQLWRGEFGPRPPFPIGRDALFVAYYASAELGCFKALGWPMPANVLDLYTEFRNRTNGLPTLNNSSGLVSALAYFGLDAVNATEKDEMRALVLRGGLGRRANVRRSLIIARPTPMRSKGCYRRCYRRVRTAASMFRAPCSAADTWPPPPPWNGTACRLTWRRWNCSGSTGPKFRMT